MKCSEISKIICPGELIKKEQLKRINTNPYIIYSWECEYCGRVFTTDQMFMSIQKEDKNGCGKMPFTITSNDRT